MNYNLRYLPFIVVVWLVCAVLFSCANMSRPTGGPKDETPPVYIKSNPLPNECNFNNKRIEIEFDEIVQVDKPSEKVIISPPQLSMPKIQAQGRKVRVELQDSLLPNTTYTIDFGDAIVDNNEKNALQGFSISFSTGAERDSLQVSGILLNAADLEPITGMMVGLYSNLDDSAFTTLPLERVTTSDARGHFVIRNLKPIPYRIVALKDANRNYFFDGASEDIAFYDSIVVPYAVEDLYVDTLFTDSMTVDSVINIAYNKFYPNNILLNAFNELKKSRIMESNVRKDRKKLEFIFSTPHDSLPSLTPLNFEPDSNWYYLEKNITNDTLCYWIKDSLTYNNDTLKVAFRYFRTDTLNEISAHTDTLTMLYRAPKETTKKKKKKVENDSLPVVIPTVFSPMNIQVSGQQDINKPVRITFDTPVDSFRNEAFHLYLKRDTLWQVVPDSLYSLTPDSLVSRSYLLHCKWAPEATYKLEADSMAVVDIYGFHTNKTDKEIKIKSLQDYANLFFAIAGVQDSAVVELLDKNDKPVVSAPVVDGGAEFTYLKPDTYYARLYIDRNGNGKYDTGEYASKRQPEEVYYYPQKLELRAYWNVEQDWNIYSEAIDKQKPLDIKKNKPKEDTKKQNDDENTNGDTYGNSYGNTYGDSYGTGNTYGNNGPMGNNPFGNTRY